MPRIISVARFTSPPKQTTKETPINTAATSSVQTFRSSLEATLKNSQQPLTVTEITELMSRTTGKAHTEAYVRLEVKALEDKGLASSRKETEAERQVRAGGKLVRSPLATLYWVPAGLVPKRTVTEAVPGFSLSPDKPQEVSFKRYKYNTKRHKKRMDDEVELVDISEPYAVPSQNQIVDMLIEKIVAERTAELQSQLAAKEAELTKLKDFLKSAL